MKELIIIGAGGHGKVVADIALQTKRYTKISFLDDRKVGNIIGLPILGTFADVKKHINNAEFFVAIGDTKLRMEILEELFGFNAKIPVLIHPKSTVSGFAKIGIGTVIMPGAIVNADAQIGKGVIINTCSSIDHDCQIGDYTHISVGAHLAGGVKIGNNVFIGTGAVVRNGIEIKNDCTIGMGAVVVNDIDSLGTYIGVPAKKM